MGTKTISLADDAYERLKAHKREGESFSDVVRRLTDSTDLMEYHGILSEETGEELEEIVQNRREARNAERERRRRGLVNSLNDG